MFDRPYVERDAVGPVNIRVKFERQAMGGPFEPPPIFLINRAAAILADGFSRVAEVGCGTGMFATELVARHGDVHVTASEFDDETLRWTTTHRMHPRITYCRKSLEELAVEKYDLVVALEVIEHIKDYATFLFGLTRVADRALISTPNKNRSGFASVAATPEFSEHVREWTAGEFYWVLSAFWQDVTLHTLPDFGNQTRCFLTNAQYVPVLRSCSVLEREEPMLALCSRPRRFPGAS